MNKMRRYRQTFWNWVSESIIKFQSTTVHIAIDGIILPVSDFHITYIFQIQFTTDMYTRVER